ncbi:MAG: cupredoxin domain-containing protein [Candidatus Limnocylindrales bacterium]|nr:cupredoxin domain-containing protein [Candidatus Limnocylindrales bacterium]
MAPPGAISIKMAWEAPRFAPDQVTAKAGTVVFFIQMSPRGSLADHNMAFGPKIYKVLARSSFVRAYKSAVFTVEGLTPGTYTFWCEVSGHAANGMVGTLTTTP